MLALESGTSFSTSLKSSWPHLDETTVMNRIDLLKANPNLIDQGSLGLCGEATFFHHVLQRNPVLFGSMAKLLFMDGWGFLNDLSIHPDPDLLNANYPAILTGDPGIPPQADWMVLSALRDSENEILDFEGKAEEDWADGSDIAERSFWYLRSRLYTAVQRDEDTSLAHVKTNILKTGHNHIALKIKADMIGGGSGKHVISLESPLLFDLVQNTVTFEYWTWGNAVVPITIPILKFQNTYLGAVVGEF